MNSLFSKRLASSNSSISRLMSDLDKGINTPNHIMLGGGNPGYVPEVLDSIQKELQAIASDSTKVKNLLADYSDSCGDRGFRESLSNKLNKYYGWEITADNIALTNGSQSAFFSIFNLLSGDAKAGKKHILLPMSPEYIGYSDTGVSEGIFKSVPPAYTVYDTTNQFKYSIDWEKVKIDKSISAICVSRPCNPTGNVITDDELIKLHGLATKNGIDLIIDNAYGAPFPNILFTDSKLIYDDNVILVLSLSKFGLPASRTGIVIAKNETIKKISAINSILTLSPSAIGARLMKSLVDNESIFTLSNNSIKPFYYARAQHAQKLIMEKLKGYPCYLHRVEGGIFLWLWCKDLPNGDYSLYQKLMEKSVTVVPGSYFFYGLEDKHDHQHSCIRISYAGDIKRLEQGLDIIADTIKKCYKS